jgi:plastocyanin
MNRDNRIDESNNTRTKAIIAIPMAGIIIVAAAVLSGLLSIISSYQQPAIAQQNMTGTNATSTTTGGGGAQSSACASTGGGGGAQNATTNATTTGGGGATNASSTTGGGGNQSTTSEVRMHIEEACMAAQNGDMQGVLLHLNLALNVLEAGTQGNMTTTAGGGGAATGVSIVPGSSSLTNTAFSPNPVQVSVGSTVRWTNDDTQPHTVVSGVNAQPDGKFDSSPNFNPLIAPGQTFEHKFTEAGQYPYYCALHPNMVGTVSVS